MYVVEALREVGAFRHRAATRLAGVAEKRWPEPLRRYRALPARPDWAAVSPPG